MSETEFEYKTTNDELLRTHYDFTWIKDAGLDFLKTVSNTNIEWFPPFDTIVKLPSGTKGKYGRYILNQCATKAGLTVSTRPPTDKGKYNLIVNGLRVSIRTSFEGKGGEWFFQQIRDPSNYDYVCWIGISPNDLTCFVLRSNEIEELIKTQEIVQQHSKDRLWCIIDVGRIPDWYLGDGTLNTAIEIFSKPSATDHTSHRGQIQSLENNKQQDT